MVQFPTDLMGQITVTIALLSLMIWLYLLLFRGQFWRPGPVLLESKLRANHGDATNAPLPSVVIVIPARNEADILPHTLKPLLEQDYPGNCTIYLVDDHSSDGTGEVARQLAKGSQIPLTVIQAKPLPAGWTGKLWALHQGIAAAPPSDYVLLTDADICHHTASLQQLVGKAMREQRDLVSLMVKLRCESAWEKLLIPAFVFFFAKLYPFTWVNQPNNPTAAAAGGCSLVRRSALENIGGIAALKDALIDDCTLAAKIKHRNEPSQGRFHNIWLGLTQDIHSLRPYATLDSIWNMVARTAYTQLNYSPLLLVGTLIGMFLVYLAAPIGIIVGLITQQPLLLAISLLTYGLITLSYIPINRFYDQTALYGLALPFIGLLYSGMTIDSARQHWQGQGGNWKGRTY